MRAFLGLGYMGKLNFAYADGYAWNAMVRDFGQEAVEAERLRLKREVPDA